MRCPAGLAAGAALHGDCGCSFCAGTPACERPVPAGQVGQLLELDDRALDVQKYRAIDKWATHLRALHQTVLNKLQ